MHRQVNVDRIGSTDGDAIAAPRDLYLFRREGNVQRLCFSENRLSDVVLGLLRSIGVLPGFVFNRVLELIIAEVHGTTRNATYIDDAKTARLRNTFRVFIPNSPETHIPERRTRASTWLEIAAMLTSRFWPVERSNTSTQSSVTFLPTLILKGIPTRSASLNFIPGRSSRSSSITSIPSLASSPAMRSDAAICARSRALIGVTTT